MSLFHPCARRTVAWIWRCFALVFLRCLLKELFWCRLFGFIQVRYLLFLGLLPCEQSLLHAGYIRPLVFEMSFFSIRLFHIVDTYLLVFLCKWGGHEVGARNDFSTVAGRRQAKQILARSYNVSDRPKYYLPNNFCCSDRSKYSKNWRVRTCIFSYI